jgi:predicted nucleotide-binding protein
MRENGAVPPKLRVTADSLRLTLSDSIARYESMRGLPAATEADRAALLAAFRSWDERNRRLLDQAFTPVAWHESSPKSEYSSLKDFEFSVIDELPSDQTSALGRLADEKKRRLASLLDSLDLYEMADEDVKGGPENYGAVPNSESSSEASTIFLVHGRDRAARAEVLRFLEQVTDARVIVLAEQPNQGQTLIEKLESHLPGAGYAVVLATADDEGRLRGEESWSLRSRQNVILELGLAVGKLGRRNVSILFEDGVELPSDYYGVVYTAFDAGGGWKLQLIGELKAAGFEVDANRALR